MQESLQLQWITSAFEHTTLSLGRSYWWQTQLQHSFGDFYAWMTTNPPRNKTEKQPALAVTRFVCFSLEG